MHQWTALTNQMDTSGQHEQLKMNAFCDSQEDIMTVIMSVKGKIPNIKKLMIVDAIVNGNLMI